MRRLVNFESTTIEDYVEMDIDLDGMDIDPIETDVYPVEMKIDNIEMDIDPDEIGVDAGNHSALTENGQAPSGLNRKGIAGHHPARYNNTARRDGEGDGELPDAPYHQPPAIGRRDGHLKAGDGPNLNRQSSFSRWRRRNNVDVIIMKTSNMPRR